MNMGLSLAPSLQLGLTLSLPFGLEKSGDIPVYSLHRIKRMLKECPIGIDSGLEKILISELLKANAQYKGDSGNDWCCLTSSNLVSALEGVSKRVGLIIGKDINTAIPYEQQAAAGIIKQALLSALEKNLEVIKQWFDKYYDELLYDMSGKIPWAVVMSLRAGLSIWIVGQSNPFNVDIGDFVLEVGASNGYYGDSPEEVWQAMGGKLLNQESDEDN